MAAIVQVLPVKSSPGEELAGPHLDRRDSDDHGVEELRDAPQPPVMLAAATVTWLPAGTYRWPVMGGSGLEPVIPNARSERQ